jgi:hypothetical protein
MVLKSRKEDIPILSLRFLVGVDNPDWYSTLYIDSELLKGITLMFSLEWENTFDIIKKYVESRYNLKINSVLFGDEQRMIK